MTIDENEAFGKICIEMIAIQKRKKNRGFQVLLFFKLILVIKAILFL